MPRRQMDYSTTHFYKIVCRDLDVKDMYVGHTTDFKTRKGCHKRVCNNSNDKQHNRSLYNCIREYGGWENWDMVLIETKALNNSLEARKREREHIEDLKPSLNEINAYRSSEELKQYKKQWTKDNEENVKDYKHNWHLNNRDRLTEIKRAKYQENKEEQIYKAKKYYQDNIEERRAVRNRLCCCDCGDDYTYANKRRHERSKKHQEYLKSLENQDD